MAQAAAVSTSVRHPRLDAPERWQRAAARAIAEGIQVRQLQGSGQWIANSGSDATVAYEVQVTGNVAHGCDCLADLNADPVCKHRAAFYLLIGAIDLTPEPDPPALGAVVCFRCRGTDADCSVCGGAGVAMLAAQAAALVAASERLAA
jgi:hypothetical protein